MIEKNGRIYAMNARVNDVGLMEIKKALLDHHKLSIDKEGCIIDNWTPDQLRAWAQDVEDSFNNGNGANFEIIGSEASDRKTHLIEITEAGFDVFEVDCGEA
jgi:hypothetical protein